MNAALSEEMIRGMDDMLACSMARSSDPETSHAAARRARCFAESHAGRILRAIKHMPKQTAAYYAQMTGLTVVQIDRRVIGLIRAGFVRVVVGADGLPTQYNGFRALEPT